ncbi:hypothetical protein GGR52DRAFT_568315 [Hypoxylon sp. FL1284]|nr:hypothetical protein GGR52DRAFT_568315 [Hypoxylon sp. FL1284]
MTQTTSPNVAAAKDQPWMKWYTPGQEASTTIHRAIEIYEGQQNGLRPAGIPATDAAKLDARPNIDMSSDTVRILHARYGLP